MGFGRAFIPKEFDAFHVSMDDSRERFLEGIEVIKRLWTEDRVTHHGTFYDLDDIHMLPRPVQQPHPPIYIAAVMTKESFEWSGQNGYFMMIVPFAGALDRNAQLTKLYRDTWAAAGHPPGEEKIQVSLHLYLAESHEEAIEGFKRPISRYIETFAEAVSSWEGRASGNYASYGQLVDAIRNTTGDALIQGHTALVGRPDEVVEELRYLRSVLGEFEPSLQLNFGGMSDRDAFRNMELFAKEVAPRITEAPVRT